MIALSFCVHAFLQDQADLANPESCSGPAPVSSAYVHWRAFWRLLSTVSIVYDHGRCFRHSSTGGEAGTESGA